MLCLILSLILTSQAQSPSSKPTLPTGSSESPKTTAKTGTQVYEEEENSTGKEADSKLKSLTAKVKVVRDDGEGREVFFTSDKVTGAFYLHRSVEHFGTLIKLLEESKKPMGQSVTIQYDDNQNIKSVKNTEARRNEDPNKKWDFGEVPP